MHVADRGIELSEVWMTMPEIGMKWDNVGMKIVKKRLGRIQMMDIWKGKVDVDGKKVHSPWFCLPKTSRGGSYDLQPCLYAAGLDQ